MKTFWGILDVRKPPICHCETE